MYKTLFRKIVKGSLSKTKKRLLEDIKGRPMDVGLLTKMAWVSYNLYEKNLALDYIKLSEKYGDISPLLYYTKGIILRSNEDYENSLKQWDIIINMKYEWALNDFFTENIFQSMQNDSLFYKAHCLYCMFRDVEAKNSLEKHMSHRRKGRESDFTLRECREFLRILGYSSKSHDRMAQKTISGCATTKQLHRIEKFIKRLSCKKDRSLLIKYLKRKCKEFPHEYWLKTELAEHLYLEGDKNCLNYAQDAFKLAPDDMLVVYNYAYSLYVNEKYLEALNALNIIREKGIAYIAYSEHGEGMSWAKKLMRDTEKLHKIIENEFLPSLDP